MSFDPHNATAENMPVGKTNWTRKFVYAKLADFRRNELPAVYAKWLANRNDPTIFDDYKKELRRIRRPDEVKPPPVLDDTQPAVDEGFRKLGIVR
jgi:hypothetical protein